jgi:hypothetical protein
MEDTLVKAQGWYRDPYRRHTARWFSDGTPTPLVRDGGVESRDDPPTTWFARLLEPVAESEGELLHTHDPRGRGSDSGVAAAWEFFVSTGGD